MKASPRLVLIGLIPGGRATTPPQLQPSPDIGEKITSYNDRSVNEDENCSSTQLQTAGSMQALRACFIRRDFDRGGSRHAGHA